MSQRDFVRSHFSCRRARFVGACLKNETVNMMENGSRKRCGEESFRNHHDSEVIVGIVWQNSVAECVAREERWYHAAPMAVVPSFDHKAEIEECAAPSAVNFRVLYSRKMPEGLAPVQGVTDFPLCSIYDDLVSNLFLSFKKNSCFSVNFKLTYLGHLILKFKLKFRFYKIHLKEVGNKIALSNYSGLMSDTFRGFLIII